MFIFKIFYVYCIVFIILSITYIYYTTISFHVLHVSVYTIATKLLEFKIDLNNRHDDLITR